MQLTNIPVVVLVSSLLLLFLTAQLGDQLRKRVIPLKEEERDDFGVVLGATLTLLGLLIGFSFRWRSAGTTSERITKKPRPTRSVPSS